MRGLGTPAFPPCRERAAHRYWRRRSSRVDPRVGTWLRHWRIERGLSQEELAAGVGLTVDQVEIHERGIELIGPQDLVSYARSLGLGLSAFVA